MRVETNTNGFRLFRLIKPGECFEYAENFYMRIVGGVTGFGQAVNLASGTLASFADSTSVRPVNLVAKEELYE